MRIEKTGRGCRVSGTLPGGDRVRKVLVGANRRQAETWWARQVSEAAEAMVMGRVVKTFREAVDLWVRDHPDRAVTGPLAEALGGAVEALGERPVSSLTPGEVRAWAEARWAGSPHSVVRWGIAPVRAVVNHAAQAGWCGSMRVRGPKLPKAVRRASTAEWRRAFRAQAEAMGAAYAGLWELVELMARTGLRTGEACALEWADVDWAAGTLRVGPTKNGNTYLVGLGEDLVAMLRRVRVEGMALASDEGVPAKVRARWRSRCVFGRPDKGLVWRQVRDVCEAAGIEALTPHEAGRHTFATRLSEEFGWSVAQIARAGRWEDPGVVARTYVHSGSTTREASGLLKE